jgi:hypothetical protein
MRIHYCIFRSKIAWISTGGETMIGVDIEGFETPMFIGATPPMS